MINDTGGAQDALQEIFLRYFVARSEGQQFVDPKAWLFRVLRNHLLDTLKSSSMKNEIAIDKIDEPHDGSNDPERHYHRAEMARDLARVLAPRELECVRLRAEGLSYDEIAQVLDLRQGTVGRRWPARTRKSGALSAMRNNQRTNTTGRGDGAQRGELLFILILKC